MWSPTVNILLISFFLKKKKLACTSAVLDLVSGGATVKLDQVVGARLQTGKRVSISNLNGPRDELLACGITSNSTSHAVLSRYLIIINNRCRCHRSSTAQKPRKKRRSPCLRSNFPRLVNFDDNPTRCVFAPGVNQSGYCSIFNYYGAVITHIFVHFCKKHAEVKQAKRIQAWRSCVC